MTALLQILHFAGISTRDLSYAGSAGMFLLLAVLACLMPARRPGRSDGGVAVRVRNGQ